MGICVARFQESAGVAKWGTVENNLVRPLSHHYASHRELMDAFWDDPTSLQLDTETAVPLEALNLLSPVTADVQIFCQGLNYASHKVEGRHGTNVCCRRDLRLVVHVHLEEGRVWEILGHLCHRCSVAVGGGRTWAGFGKERHACS